MKIGVSSYSFSQLISSGKETQLSVIKIAKEMGFDGIEFTDLHVPEGMTENEMAVKIREECEKYSLPVASYTIGANLLCDEGLDYEVERVCKKVDTAKILGVKCMRHDTAWNKGSFLSFDAALPTLIEGCRRITEYAESIGVETMTENHGYFCQNSERVERIISGVNSKNFGSLLDIGNFSCVDESNTDAVRRLSGFIKHVHAKDFHIKSGSEFNPGDGFFKSGGGNYLRGAIIGQGNVPVYQCISIIKESGYDGYISVEFEGREDCLYGIKTGFDNLKRMLG